MPKPSEIRAKRDRLNLELQFDDRITSMSNRNRNFRRRADDDEDNNDNTLSTTTAVAAKKPSSKPKKLLSFADDEEEKSETLRSSRDKKQSSRLSKPSSSNKLSISKDRLPPPSTSLLSYVQPQTGVYTKEALLELQKNTKTLAVSSSKPASTDTSSEPKVILKGLIKPQVSTPVQEKTSRDPSNSDSDSDSDRGNDTEKRFASRGIGKIEVQSGVIYDEAAIKAIRAKKDRIRQQSQAAAPDYISLDGGGGSSHRADVEGLSDEEPEFPRRMAMFGEKIESGAKKKGVFEDDDDEDERPVVVPVENGDEYDDEDKMWEEEQVRKGLGKRLDDGPSRGVASTSASVTIVQPQKQNLLYPTMAPYGPAGPTPSIGGAVGASQDLDTMSIAQKADSAMKALQNNVNRLRVWLILLSTPWLILYFIV